MMAAPDHSSIICRLQILRGKLYMQILPQGYTYMNRIESMLQQIQDAMLSLYPALNDSTAAVDVGPFGRAIPPDVDFRLATTDGPAVQTRAAPPRMPLLAPILTMAASAEALSTAVPDFSFDRWSETGVGDEKKLTYTELMSRILDAADRKPYEARIKRATFRGRIENPDRVLMKPWVRKPRICRSRCIS